MLLLLFRGPSVDEIPPEILDGPWAIKAGDVVMHGWVEAFDKPDDGPLATTEMVATKEESIGWLSHTVGWEISALSAFEVYYTASARMDISTSGDIPGGPPTSGGSRPSHSKFGKRKKDFHEPGWYTVVSYTDGKQVTAYLEISASGEAYTENLHWPDGFLRPKLGTKWTITWRENKPDPLPKNKMVATVTHQ